MKIPKSLSFYQVIEQLHASFMLFNFNKDKDSNFQLKRTACTAMEVDEPLQQSVCYAIKAGFH